MGGILYAIILVAVTYSMYHLWKILRLAARKYKSRDWPVTTGKVIKQDVHKVTSIFTLVTGLLGGDVGLDTYRPEISYSYTVLGKEFKNTLFLGLELSEGRAANATYNFGETVILRYNPNQPEEQIAQADRVKNSDIVAFLVPWLIVWFLGYILLTAPAPYYSR
jgi:hypothetical protein